MFGKTVRIFHTYGCARCRAAGEYFSLRGYDVQWLDIAKSMTAKREMLSLVPGNREVPVVQWGEIVKVGWDHGFWKELLEGS